MPIRRKIRYTKGNLCVIWQPHKCVHSYNCANNLPKVFSPDRRPWIELDHANQKAIIEAVNDCPTQALTYLLKNDDMETEKQNVSVKVTPNGPLIFQGNLSITLANGEVKPIDNPVLCRCGGSKNKPFCDGTHREINFTD